MRGRPRHQTGYLVARGLHWRGEYHQHLTQPDGTVKRVHRSVVLGLRSEMPVTSARRALREVIARETHVHPSGKVTLEWFILNRWLPERRARWREWTYRCNLSLITNRIIKPLGSMPLEAIDKFTLQTHINQLAETASYSAVQHTHSFLRDIFAECAEMEFIPKSPATRLQMPRVVRPWSPSPEGGLDVGKFYLSIPQLRALLAAMPNVGRPDRLIVMLCGILALRPSECFGLTWQCYTEDGLYIMQRVLHGNIDIPKSEASRATIPVPSIIRAALDRWKSECRDSSDSAFIFASKNRTPIDRKNFCLRIMQPVGAVTNAAAPVNFQVLRRTAATHVCTYGAGEKELQVIMRHASAEHFSVSVYQQAIRQRVLDVLERFANDVLAGLPDSDHFEIPLEHNRPPVTHASSQLIA